MLPPHPDRLAETLAQLPGLRGRAGPGPFASPAAGSSDARIDLKLLLWQALGTLHARGTPAAHERFAALEGEHLHAGTVRDGVARGVKVALEETVSLCEPRRDDAPEALPPRLPEREVKKTRDVAVASGGARVRWTRKSGLIFVDREHGVHAERCIVLEDRSDAGTLDGFVPRGDERPRLFDPAFLRATHVEHGKERDLLLLEGRLGRGRLGHACSLVLEGRKREPFVRLSFTIENRHADHRLRMRVYGVPEEMVSAHGMPLLGERVAHAHGTFLAATLVRACGRLAVGGETIGVPEAQCLTTIRREFLLGPSG